MLSYNIWSGSDSNNNITGWSGRYNIFSSRDFSSTGDFSFKLTYYGNSSWNSVFIESLTAGEYQLKCDVLSKDTTCTISLISLDGDNIISTHQAVSVDSNEWQSISLNNTIEDRQTFQILISNNSGTSKNKPIYIDNMSITIQ